MKKKANTNEENKMITDCIAIHGRCSNVYLMRKFQLNFDKAELMMQNFRESQVKDVLH